MKVTLGKKGTIKKLASEFSRNYTLYFMQRNGPYRLCRA